LLYRTSAASGSNGQTQTLTSLSVGDGTTVNNLLLIGSQGLLTSITVTPYISGVAQSNVVATTLIETASGPRNSFSRGLLPDGTTTVDIAIVHTTNPSHRPYRRSVDRTAKQSLINDAA
jgi:hypothetical protein